MVFLSVTLKDSVNRWANIIIGIVFTGFGLFELVSYLGTKPSGYYSIVISVVGLVFSVLIVWYAWKWPKK